MVADQQWRLPEAEQNYRRALEIYLEFNDRYSAASAYHQLGIVAQEQRRFPEAEQNYRRALEIYLEFDDRYSAASTYHQLGRDGQGQGRVSEGGGNHPRGEGELPQVKEPKPPRHHLPPPRTEDRVRRGEGQRGGD